MDESIHWSQAFFFKWFVDIGLSHSQRDWDARVNELLLFFSRLKNESRSVRYCFCIRLFSFVSLWKTFSDAPHWMLNQPLEIESRAPPLQLGSLDALWNFRLKCWDTMKQAMIPRATRRTKKSRLTHYQRTKEENFLQLRIDRWSLGSPVSFRS
jgi:hypothetical protein